MSNDCSNTPCNLCGSTTHRIKFTFDEKSILACENCGLRFYHPIPSVTELSALYDDPAYSQDSYFEPGESVFHLYYFNPDIIEHYLRKAGFVLDKIVLENYDPRKATENTFMRAGLRAIYQAHNMTGKKTNMYIYAWKQ